mmetsp:Transcript_35005/g.87297  ORF Transcript_35005/g.87297 Transcript_35005/m.87297 type:complete len:260 (+) Transcript_35005:184-963(+)
MGECARSSMCEPLPPFPFPLAGVPLPPLPPFPPSSFRALSAPRLRLADAPPFSKYGVSLASSSSAAGASARTARPRLPVPFPPVPLPAVPGFALGFGVFGAGVFGSNPSSSVAGGSSSPSAPGALALALRTRRFFCFAGTPSSRPSETGAAAAGAPSVAGAPTAVAAAAFTRAALAAFAARAFAAAARFAIISSSVGGERGGFADLPPSSETGAPSLPSATSFLPAAQLLPALGVPVESSPAPLAGVGAGVLGALRALQ